VRVVPWKDLLVGRQVFAQPVRLSIGVFDGLHVGHRRLIDAIMEGEQAAVPLVVTFPRSPAQVLDPRRFPGLILSYRQKLTRLAELGIGAVVEIDFSGEMSNLSGKDFISLLKDHLTIEKIVVGFNFRFGRAREAGSCDLREMLADTGIEMRVTDPVFRGDAIVSSSRIRKTIQEGDFAEARAMLLADYSLDLRGVESGGEGPGVRRFGRSLFEQVLPGPGRYDVSCDCGGKLRPAELTISGDALTLAAKDVGEPTTIIFH
jgi:riboflavin kinase/FMN adenylyltransferase